MTSKVKSKGGFVTDHAFENLTQGWKLRCDESVDEVEYEKDLRMILKDAARREWLWHDRTRRRVAGEPCDCRSSSSSGIERRKGENQGPEERSCSWL